MASLCHRDRAEVASRSQPLALGRCIRLASNLSLLKITQGPTHTTSQQQKLL